MRRAIIWAAVAAMAISPAWAEDVTDVSSMATEVASETEAPAEVAPAEVPSEQPVLAEVALAEVATEVATEAEVPAEPEGPPPPLGPPPVAGADEPPVAPAPHQEPHLATLAPGSAPPELATPADRGLWPRGKDDEPIAPVKLEPDSLNKAIGNSIIEAVKEDPTLALAVVPGSQLVTGARIVANVGARIASRVTASTGALVGDSGWASVVASRAIAGWRSEAQVAERAATLERALSTVKPGSPSGITVEGTVYRIDRTQYRGNAWESPDLHNIAQNFRYSPPDEGARYAALEPVTAMREVHLRRLPGPGDSRVLHSRETRIENVLDLTDSGVRRQLGVRLPDIVGTSASTRYNLTQPISRWARDKGYNGILAPSAQRPGGSNLVSFRDIPDVVRR